MRGAIPVIVDDRMVLYFVDECATKYTVRHELDRMSTVFLRFDTLRVGT